MAFNPGKIPLYRLPVLPFQEVIKSMELDVMFFFSLTSHKAQKMLKISLPKHNLHLDCSLWIENKITVGSPSSSDKFVLKFSNTVPDGSKTFQLQNVQFRYFQYSDANYFIRGNEPLVVMVRELITHLAVSLHLPKISLDFQAVIAPGVALELLNHSKSLSLPMKNIKLWTRNTSAEIYKAFLDEGSRITDTFIMGCRAPVGFRYTPSEDFHLERFEVKDGFWISFEDFVHCKHVIIDSNSSINHVNAQRLNGFFKAWQRSSYRLERVVIYFGHTQWLNFEEVIMGLNGTNIIRDQFEKSVDIERQDGKKATIQLNLGFATLFIKS